LPEFPGDGAVASNLTLTGDSSLLAVNSYIDVDFGPAADIDDWYLHNVLVLEDSSVANLYGSHFEPYLGSYSLRAPAVSANGESYFALPATKATEDNTGQPIADLLASDEGAIYHVDPGERLSIETFSAGTSSAIDGATLYVRYSVGSTYNGDESFEWRLEGGTYASTGITPVSSETTYVERSFDLYSSGVTTTDEIATMDVTFLNSGSSGSVGVDSMSIVVTIGPEAYVYRWINITVGDEYGVPIPDCEISAVFTGSTSFGGQPSFYFGADGVSSTPPESVLEYMGTNEASFGITGAMGVAQIPLLTDLISGGEYPNSLYVGAFELTGTVEQDSVVYSSMETFAFPAYPAMTSADQHFEVTVDVEGISAESPDSSRWLVVPPDLLIEDMQYYHAGDVIVASDGTLTLRNAVFYLVQTYANEHTIYVDGTANFVIEDSQLVSALPVDVIVKGQGTLKVIDSTLTGVNIVAMEDAVVELNGASFDGKLTTAWDSEAHIMIYDSVLVQSPEISGSTVCEITNTSAPSITVLDDAMALLYRWIHVTVFDGGDYPLEGADVYARFYVNETFWTSSKTDPTGVARLKSLGTILTSSGSTYVGQYRVNASYWSDGVEHVSDSEVSVSVLPYTQPLTENATFAVLFISSVLLPDLSIASEDILTDPEDVVLNSDADLYARIWNYGETAAINASVDFLVGDTLATAELIDTAVIDTIAAGSFRDASVTWVPDATGEHTVWVDVNAGPDFDERTFNNNNASLLIDVLDYADLDMYPISFYLYGTANPLDSIAGGEDITISGYLYNVGEAPVSGISVRMTVTSNGTAVNYYQTITETLETNDRYLVSFDYTLEPVVENTEVEFAFSVNPAMSIPETSYVNNNQSATLTVLDIRADFSISAGDVYVQYGAEDNVEPIYGNTVTIVATVYNLGGTDPGDINISFGFVDMPVPFAIVNESIMPGMSREIRVDYLINLTDGGPYDLYVDVDCNGSYYEKNETNNYVEIEFEVTQLVVDITVTTGAEYEADDTMVVTVSIVYAGTQTPVKSLRGVSVELVPPDGEDAVVWSEGLYTNSVGVVGFELRVPATAESGTYTVVCHVVGLTETGSASVEIIGTVSGGGIPLLVWIVVIAAIAAVVIGFTAYTYIYGLGKLVECGECGEFIPAASKRCPKCGVEFEAGTMKCSECGAWVPAESTECPNCGVKFVGEELGEEDYLEKMRKEYDEMASKYRELAKAELGKKFSDKAFEQWWMAQPSYISFDDWLAKEEEKRKETPVACPVCGTLNPKEATVCNKCGTVFAAAATAPVERRPPQTPPGGGGMPAQAPPAQQPSAEPAQQPAAPRMVIRRPIDRKVVPKKVIKTPLGGQGEGDTQNGENQ
jgi:ribosomal protein L40E